MSLQNFPPFYATHVVNRLIPYVVFLFSGTPVNRVPIMAKQTLDLFKLFKLVVEKGGLVEVGK